MANIYTTDMGVAFNSDHLFGLGPAHGIDFSSLVWTYRDDVTREVTFDTPGSNVIGPYSGGLLTIEVIGGASSGLTIEFDPSYHVEWTTGPDGFFNQLFESLTPGSTATFLSGSDTFTGSNLGDILKSYAGNDMLDGGAGMDTMIGGAGDDIYIVDDAGDVVTEAVGEGYDRIRTSIDFVIASNIEKLKLTGTAIQGTGNGVDNLIGGNSSGNTLRGLGGSDVLMAWDGDDVLLGGGSDDRLAGGIGDDRLSGGSGADSLRGGEGSDTFSFAARKDGGDIIHDFEAGTDFIGLGLGLFDGRLPSPGVLSASMFQANAKGEAEDASDRVIYNTRSGALWFDTDGTGGKDAVLLAKLRGAPDLSHADILVM